jgi:hypothetical protein
VNPVVGQKRSSLKIKADKRKLIHKPPLNPAVAFSQPVMIV